MTLSGFATRLTDALESKGWSANELYRHVRPECARATFFRIKRGESEPAASFVVAAARALDVSIEWLLTGTGAMRPLRRLPQAAKLDSLRKVVGEHMGHVLAEWLPGYDPDRHGEFASGVLAELVVSRLMADYESEQRGSAFDAAFAPHYLSEAGLPDVSRVCAELGHALASPLRFARFNVSEAGHSRYVVGMAVVLAALLSDP